MSESAVWWSDGLHFTCTQCGACCGGVPGTISFTEEELAAMSEKLGMTVRAFVEEYVWTKYYNRPSLKERDDLDCILLDPETRRCRVYDARPAQCRTFPFWKDVLRSRREWDEYAERCPGMNCGEFFSAEQIVSILESRDS